MKVDRVIDRIIDDFCILTEKELLVKHRPLGKKRVRIALKEIYEIVKQGLLSPHEPSELSSVDVVSYQGQNHEIAEFWKNRASLLVLDITERCNLCCSYCCFSGNFEGHRTHSQKSMSWEIAERAMSHFLENDQVGDGTYPITFYGGEPLLEFELVKKCVSYAETKASELGKTVRFSITTNGTLLTDDVVDYLVRHGFLTLVSLDGPKSVHDRYRVFPEGQGSFDVVENNLRRFAGRYPDFKNRGLSVTLAPPLDLESTARWIEELYSAYPVSRVALVNTGTGSRIRDGKTGVTRSGCHATCKQSCKMTEPFQEFGREDQRQLKEQWNLCIQRIKEFGAEKARKRIPFAMLLFEQQIAFYHRRQVSNEPSERYFYIPCIPGFTRRFCDVDGNYRVCERVDNSLAYRMGNVWDGPDPERLKSIMEERRHLGDCANCTALKTCEMCYARIPGTDLRYSEFDPMFDRMCQWTRKTTKKLLRTYTEIMETNPDAFGKTETKKVSGADKIQFGSLTELPNETLKMQMEREEAPSVLLSLLTSKES